jgi:23S rRNA (cytosine1962-C5)-methyltransferase
LGGLRTSSPTAIPAGSLEDLDAALPDRPTPARPAVPEAVVGRIPAVRLTPKGLGRARTGHPWVYRSDLAHVPGELVGGEVVRLDGPRSEILGIGLYSARSIIALRLFRRGGEPVDEAFWTARIDAALALRSELFPGSTVGRLVYGEADGLPSLVADRYGDYLVVQLLSQGAERLRALWVAHLQRRLAPRGILARNDVRVRELEGLPLAVELLHGEVPESVEVDLEGVRLRVDLRGGQKTGAFLDQRENYRVAGELARGRVLDAFSYQGAFALHAGRRADRVDAVEIAAAALRRGEENARLNGIENVRFVEANAFDFLHETDAAGGRYETVILDPPAFAKNRKSLEAGLRGYKEINLRAMRLLEPGGILLTCSCSHHVTPELFLDVLAAAAHDAGRACQILERRGASRDHPALATCPETGYLKCVVARIL